MKIIGGKYKGRNFYLPEGVRAAQNVVRKAVFDILGQDLEGLTFLDLFAGSGAMGIEALSRGAERVTFVEREPRCVEVIEKNLTLFNISSKDENRLSYEVFSTDAFMAVRMLVRQEKFFDVIFMDPPYGADLAKKALKTLDGCVIVHPNSWVVVQHDRPESLPQETDKLGLVMERRYGGTMLSVYQCKVPPSDPASKDAGRYV